MDAQTETSEDCECNVHPSIFFLFGTLLLTRLFIYYVFSSCATAMLCAAIMTDHWEHVTWSRSVVENATIPPNVTLDWYLDRTVVRMTFHNHRDRSKTSVKFLVPMNGGIWTLCATLNDDEIMVLEKAGFPKKYNCTNYLAGNEANRGKEEETKADWQHRLQNLSISCALVCMIVLGSAALVGAFGVCKHQISAVLVTGVMYLLAALFALFTLMIVHFKRQPGRPRVETETDGIVDDRRPARIPLDLLAARVFSTSWSLDLGWGGVALCALTSFFWIMLSKIMRFNPISAMLV